MYETAELNLDLAGPTKQDRHCATGEKHVLFRLGEELFCLPAKNVRGVMGFGSLIPAADSNFLLIGFVFCQAKALPVFDLRPPLGLPATALCGKEEVLVLSHSSDARFRLGVLVESLENAREIHADSIQRISHNRIPQQFLRGMALCDAKKVLMLDLDFVISPAALRRLYTVAEVGKDCSLTLADQ